MSMTVYLDSAASTRIDDRVWEHMISLRNVYGNASCSHAMGREARDIIEDAREIIAKRINAEPCEIIFVSSGTHANNLAIAQAGVHILTTATEHVSLLEPVINSGLDYTILPVNEQGLVNTHDIEDAICHDTDLISVIGASNELGTLNNIAAIGEIAKWHGCLFHSDCIAMLPHMDVDVKSLGLDLASFASHKLHGPKGIGALYVSKKISVNPLIHGGGSWSGLESGTQNTIGIAGFAKAVEILEHDSKAMELTNVLERGILERIPIARINNPSRGLPILSVCFLGVDGRELVQRLSDNGIYTSQWSCSNRGVSHILEAVGLSRDEAGSSVRFSPSKHTAAEEVDFVVETLAGLLNPA